MGSEKVGECFGGLYRQGIHETRVAPGRVYIGTGPESGWCVDGVLRLQGFFSILAVTVTGILSSFVQRSDLPALNVLT